jgi:hypothetical protein
MATTFTDKCTILSDVWIKYRHDEDLKDYIEYNDLGLPLAFAISEGIIEASELAIQYVEEAFGLLLVAMELEDEGFESLDDLLMRFDNK